MWKLRVKAKLRWVKSTIELLERSMCYRYLNYLKSGDRVSKDLF